MLAIYAAVLLFVLMGCKAGDRAQAQSCLYNCQVVSIELAQPDIAKPPIATTKVRR